jgi:hypothetical protein
VILPALYFCLVMTTMMAMITPRMTSTMPARISFI